MLPDVLAALEAIAPFFAVVLIGWLAAKRGLFDKAGLAGLTAFVFYIALPPLLFQAMARTPLVGAEAGALRFALIWGGATLALYLLAWLFGRLGFGLRPPEATLHAHLACNGNVGFIGLPLVPALFGGEALAAVALALTIDIVVVMSLTAALLSAQTAQDGSEGVGQRGDQGGGSALARAAAAAGRALLNPIPIAAVAGGLWGATAPAAGLETPEMLGALLDLLGQAAPPAALFAVGATLAHATADRRSGEVGLLCLWKLVAHPALIAAGLLIFAAPGSDAAVPAIWIAGGLAAAACPSSNNAVIFAVRHGVYAARASATVLVSTGLSLIALAAVAVIARAWLGV